MINQLLLLFLALFVSFLAYPLWISFVYKYHMGENIRSEGPQSHLKKKGTPTMGGFVFIFVVSMVTFVFNQSQAQTLLPIFVASMAGVLGLLEDLSKIYKTSVFNFAFRIRPNISFGPISRLWAGFKEVARIVGSKSDRGMQTYQKFLVQGGIAAFISYWTYFKLGWDYIWMPLVGNIGIGVLYPIFIFFLFIVVLNFVAFTDGIDGLAGGLGTIAFACYWVIASYLGYNSLGALAATFIGALLPFLYFNVYPARIFMGDVGSHVLGATLAIFAVVMHREIVLFFVLAVFLVDGITSPLQQFSVKLTGKRLFRMAPIHHHFEVLGWPETKVTFRFWIFGAIFGLLGILISIL